MRANMKVEKRSICIPKDCISKSLVGLLEKGPREDFASWGPDRFKRLGLVLLHSIGESFLHQGIEVTNVNTGTGDVIGMTGIILIGDLLGILG